MDVDATAGSEDVATLPYTDTAVWRLPAQEGEQQATEPTLYDTAEDPAQTENLVAERPAEADRMQGLVREALETLEAPAEQFDRLGL
jgi:hypothetical protein